MFQILKAKKPTFELGEANGMHSFVGSSLALPLLSLGIVLELIQITQGNNFGVKLFD